MPRFPLPAVVRALRPHHWSKNLLVLLPLVLAHRLNDALRWEHGLYMFAAFCAVSSAVYICNDLNDVESDKLHPEKKHRPFASGELNANTGWLVTAVLLGIGFVFTLAIPDSRAVFILGVYLGAATLYTFVLKRLVLLDVLSLTTLYLLRLMAGAVATNTTVSEWLLMFSFFFALSLALLKRYSEITQAKEDGKHALAGRGYTVADGEFVSQTGTAAGLLSIVIFTLYISSSTAASLYRTPQLLWLLCPLLLYWILRLWLLANRGKLQQDPVAFALTDAPSFAVLALCTLFAFLAS